MIVCLISVSQQAEYDDELRIIGTLGAELVFLESVEETLLRIDQEKPILVIVGSTIGEVEASEFVAILYGGKIPYDGPVLVLSEKSEELPAVLHSRDQTTRQRSSAEVIDVVEIVASIVHSESRMLPQSSSDFSMDEAKTLERAIPKDADPASTGALPSSAAAPVPAQDDFDDELRSILRGAKPFSPSVAPLPREFEVEPTTIPVPRGTPGEAPEDDPSSTQWADNAPAPAPIDNAPVPAADSSLPTADSTLPAADSPLPAADSTLPAADSTLPAADSSQPAADSSHERADDAPATIAQTEVDGSEGPLRAESTSSGRTATVADDPITTPANSPKGPALLSTDLPAEPPSIPDPPSPIALPAEPPSIPAPPSPIALPAEPPSIPAPPSPTDSGREPRPSAPVSSPEPRKPGDSARSAAPAATAAVATREPSNEGMRTRGRPTHQTLLIVLAVCAGLGGAYALLSADTQPDTSVSVVPSAIPAVDQLASAPPKLPAPSPSAALSRTQGAPSADPTGVIALASASPNAPSPSIPATTMASSAPQPLFVQEFPLAFRRSGLSPTLTSMKDLLAIVAEVQRDPAAIVELVGHSSNDGDRNPDVDVQFGRIRAEAARDVLVAQGVSAQRIRIRSAGSSEPVAPNDTEENRRRNRRVVLKVYAH